MQTGDTNSRRTGSTAALKQACIMARGVHFHFGLEYVYKKGILQRWINRSMQFSRVPHCTALSGP